jgi:hypothetical protein
MRHTVIAVLTVLSVSLPVSDFVRLHRMSDEDVRTRFALPRDCRPRLTAIADPPGRVKVLVTCEVAEARRPASRSP